MPYPSIGPNPLDPTQPRLFLDDGHLPSRATIVAQPNQRDGDQAQMYENAYRAIMLNEARVGYGWVQAPAGLDGASPVTWALSADNVNPSGQNPTQNLDGLSEAFYTASVDVSGWLAHGHKVKNGNTYGIVTYVSGATVGFLGPNSAPFANRFGVWAGQGFFVPSPTMWYSAAKAPVGFPTNPAVWTAYIISPITSSGGGGAKAAGSLVAISPLGDNTWRTWDTLPGTNPPTWLMRLPIGDWQIDFSALVQYDRNSGGDIGVQIGLARNATLGGIANDSPGAPDGDLLWDAYIDPGGTAAPTARGVAFAQADRTVNAQDMPFGLWGKVKSGTNSRVLLRNDLRPTILRARCTLL